MPKKRYRTYAAEWLVRITELLHTVCGTLDYSVAAAIAAYSNEWLAAVAHVVVALLLIGAIILGVKHALRSAHAFLKSFGDDEQDTSAKTSTPAEMNNGKVGNASLQATHTYDRNNIINFPNAQVHVDTINCVVLGCGLTCPSCALGSRDAILVDISQLLRAGSAVRSAPEGIDLENAA
jgi:hypothetical protein